MSDTPVIPGLIAGDVPAPPRSAWLEMGFDRRSQTNRAVISVHDAVFLLRGRH